MADSVAYFKGEWLPMSRMRIDPLDRGFLVGDVVFDVARTLAFFASTSPCVLPVSRVDRRTIGDGTPGPIARRLLAAWSETVGLDIVAQARQFAALEGPESSCEAVGGPA